MNVSSQLRCVAGASTCKYFAKLFTV